MGAAEECLDGDTMAFYASGAWAVTNAGGNPVEAIGVWSLAQGSLVVDFSDLDMPDQVETATGLVGADGETQFRLTSDMVAGGEQTLYRCSE
ncbi:MAG: hypothetical protein R3F55_24285 [Alphaproteobacteria bacterium]